MHQIITVKDCGPITRLEIPVQPGATVLRGRSDQGKSQTLKAVNRLAGGKCDVTPRHGANTGEIDGLGIHITVGRSVRRSGSLEALAIESEFPLSDLIDPGYDDPVAADKRRIKALLKIAGAKADVNLFAGLLPGGVKFLEPFVSASAAETTDIVDLAGKLKRSLEDAARKAADEANKELGAAAGCREATDGLDLSGVIDPAIAQAAHTAAVTHHASLEQQARGYRQAMKQRQEAERKLAESAGEYKGPSVADADAEYKTAETHERNMRDERDAVLREIDVLTSKLAVAGERLTSATMAVVAAQRSFRAAQSHEKALADANKALELTLPPAPDQEAIDTAAEKVEEARQAIENAAVLRKARQKVQEAERHELSAKQHRERAECLRSAAKATDDVLSQAVASSRLKVRDGRLVTEVDGRGEVYYHDRSDGTRTLIALQEKLDRIRQLDPDASKLAIIELPQRNRQDLQPSHWRECVEWAREHNVCLITAEVDDEELRAEVA